MQIQPHYEAPAIIDLDGDPLDQAETMLRQRRRLESLVAGFTDEQWRHDTRCEGWSVQDVIQHLTDVNAFWGMSIKAGRAGAPTRVLAGFDPAATPAQLVAAAGTLEPAETLERFVSSNDRLTRALDGLDADGWLLPAEAPPGHISIRAMAHHALWDGWIHERDIAIPQGIETPQEADEIAAGLRYASALSPAFALSGDRSRTGELHVVATDPAIEFTVVIDGVVRVVTGAGSASAVRLNGSAIDLLEMLSTRVARSADIAEQDRWIFDGLAEVFDQ